MAYLNRDRRKGGIRSVLGWLVIVLVVVLAGLIYLVFRGYRPNNLRNRYVLAWMRSPFSKQEWTVSAGARCGEAPFLIPSDGFIGYLWNDSFRIGHHHQGIDIFGASSVNVTPVVAAFPGYLTRLPDWKASVIIRIPDDPIQPGRQIWTYYTHMANPDGESFVSQQFPPGTNDVYVDAGTLLGYQGNYSGTPDNPVGVHLHFSIVLDNGQGSFRNELEFANTIDPSPYLGLPLNAALNMEEIPTCELAAEP